MLRRPRPPIDPSRDRRRHGQPTVACKLSQVVECRLRIADDAGPRGEDVLHACAMPVGFALATILRMGEGNEVVDEIDRPQPMTSNPSGKRRVVQPSVADVQVDLPPAWLPRQPARRGSGPEADQLLSPNRLVRQEQPEQPIGMLRRKDELKAFPLDDRL